MSTDLQAKALDVVTVAAGGKPILPGSRLRLLKTLRNSIKDTTGRAPMTLGPLLEAVDWAVERINTTNLDRCRVRNSLGFGWSYRFPNGHEATVVNDPSRPFRFEVCSAALNVGGDTIAGLTSEQVEAKLHYIAALPNR